MNAWADAHARWYARATPAERAAFDASRDCPRQEVFTPAKFPTLTAWALFLTRQRVLTEALAGMPLPMRHVVKGQVRVYDARQDREKAIAGVGTCCNGICSHEGVERYRCVATPEGGSAIIEVYLCADCAKWRRLDPFFCWASVDLAPLEV